MMRADGTAARWFMRCWKYVRMVLMMMERPVRVVMMMPSVNCTVYDRRPFSVVVMMEMRLDGDFRVAVSNSMWWMFMVQPFLSPILTTWVLVPLFSLSVPGASMHREMDLAAADG